MCCAAFCLNSSTNTAIGRQNEMRSGNFCGLLLRQEAILFSTSPSKACSEDAGTVKNCQNTHPTCMDKPVSVGNSQALGNNFYG